jgi:hypothetical protein
MPHSTTSFGKSLGVGYDLGSILPPSPTIPVTTRIYQDLLIFERGPPITIHCERVEGGNPSDPKAGQIPCLGHFLLPQQHSKLSPQGPSRPWHCQCSLQGCSDHAAHCVSTVLRSHRWQGTFLSSGWIKIGPPENVKPCQTMKWLVPKGVGYKHAEKVLRVSGSSFHSDRICQNSSDSKA